MKGLRKEFWMSQTGIEQHLTQTLEHIALGEVNMARQRQLIAELQRDGHDTTEAMELLAMLEETQRIHVETRERLQQQLWRDR
jgi:hypothetical protein